jgi:hypothetical protein
MKILTTQALSLLVLTFALAIPVVTEGQSVGTSCADCPNLRAEFSIENKTGVTIRYQVRWGDNHQWKPISLESGHIERHWYPLNESGRAPSPHVRYDKVGGDGAVTWQEFHVQFHAVGYAGYGPNANHAGPKKYYFEYGADHRSLTLYAY